MKFEKLLLAEGFFQESNGIFFRSVPFMEISIYPSIFDYLEKYVQEHGYELAFTVVDYVVDISIDPNERDFHYDFGFRSLTFETFYPTEDTREQQFIHLMTDIGEHLVRTVSQS